MSAVNRTLLARLVPNVTAAAGAERRRLRAGPFEAFIAEGTDDYFMSFAVPVEPCRDWRPAVEALDALFRAQGRIPRLEFFRELHPALAPTLYAMGYHRNMEAPVMVLESARWPGARVDRTGLIKPGDEAAIDAALSVQQTAFQPMLDPAALADWRGKIIAGIRTGMLRAALLRDGGKPVATAILMLGAGVAELAGVGTVPDHRRRGFAQRVCRLLLGAYFADGFDIAWLSAAPEADGLYRKLGFQPVGTQLNFGAKAV
jgi:ribosomal protein S18 acetylase RimI-like enzyme